MDTQRQVEVACRDRRRYDCDMRLYMLQGCPFAHRAAIALREKNLTFDTVFFEAGKRPPELAAVGPRAKSPTLFDGAAHIYDSQVVLEYLEDRYPEPALLPHSPDARAEVRMLIARIGDEVAPKFGAFIAEKLFKTPRDEGTIAEAKKAFLEALKPWNEHLAQRAFVVGDKPTLADLTLYTFLPAFAAQTNESLPGELTHLNKYIERMSARPSTVVPSAS
jgi:glutathione S-transferase